MILDIMNHIRVLNDDYTTLSVDVGVLKNQMSSMLWWFRAFASASMVILVTQIWQVLHLRRNGKK
ncbi:hypothetical protein LCGC14_0961400 [marine sediment metagenome]|uniref:GOLD domain-containing protein n=1 Tax=marine sediment metagenome TaxID=412755 RepID=A0A0F9QXK7_9ZZZZ